MKDRMPMGYWNRPAIELAITHPIEAANGAGGYIRISRDNVVIYLHRWLWEKLKGPIPLGYEIDHENGIRTDCDLNNLRCVPQIFNLRNSGKRSDNTSGVTGVSWWSAGNAWRAVTYNYLTKKQKSITFSINKYGNETAFIMACDARADMIEELNKLGAGYSDRHGK